MVDAWAGVGAALVSAIDSITRETLLFAAVAFAVGGIDDLAVDLLFLARRAIGRGRTPSLASLPAPPRPGRLAIFVPAWDESAVIGAMLSTAVARIDHADYRIFAGCYPNDRATIEAVAEVAARDPRVRLVIGDHDGPTTKADCLNALWRALRRDDDLVGERTLAIILHDAEDVIDRAELRVLDAHIRDHAVVQVPVVPLIVPGARLISGHYCDEFAEAHGKVLPVRVALGAGMPLAGVGCAIRIDALDRIAAIHGEPFDAGSLTEDYELGLRINGLGLPACFARYRDPADGRLVAVRGYFPATLHASVVQKARWMTGIALAGWDRTGWGHALNLGDHWMRMRDRRAPLAVLSIAIAYVALLCWALGMAAHHLAGTSSPPLAPFIGWLIVANAVLMAWRIAMRIAMTARLYGWREGLWAVPRMFVANLIAVLAARRAVDRYIRGLSGQVPRWDKTAHVFPDAAVVADAHSAPAGCS